MRRRRRVRRKEQAHINNKTRSNGKHKSQHENDNKSTRRKKKKNHLCHSLTFLSALKSSTVLTVDVVDLEEELDLVVRGLPRELVHGVDELLQADGPVVVLVEDVEHALNEERLGGGDKRRRKCEMLSRRDFFPTGLLNLRA